MDELVSADFERARRKAFFRDLRGLFRRQPNSLLAFRDVQQRISVDSQRYRGLQTVRLEEIVGSFDRFQDFDRAFLPKRRNTAHRWKSIDRAHYQDVVLPPIQLYKIADIYFVKDGNHRVSVARERGVEFIDAEIVEASIRAPIYASMSPTNILLQIEYAEFLRRTNLDYSRPEHDIRPSALGRYDELLQYIRQFAADAANSEATLFFESAASDWFDNAYMPVVTAIRKRQMMRRFPGRSEADAYLWVMSRRSLFEAGPEQTLDTEAASLAYSQGTAPLAQVTQPIRTVGKVARQTVERAIRKRRTSEEENNSEVNKA